MSGACIDRRTIEMNGIDMRVFDQTEFRPGGEQGTGGGWESKR